MKASGFLDRSCARHRAGVILLILPHDQHQGFTLALRCATSRGMIRVVHRLAPALTILSASLVPGATAGGQPMVAPAPAMSRPVITGQVGFGSFLQALAERARGEGVRESTIHAVIDTLSYDPEVVWHDRSQPGGTPGAIPRFEPYRRNHVDAGRIARGRTLYGASAPLIAQIEARYGVPGPIVLAIWGHESNYGSFTGTYDLPRAIASLAYEGRRRELFSQELRIAKRAGPTALQPPPRYTTIDHFQQGNKFLRKQIAPPPFIGQ